jgi:hypothetical protein
VFSLLKFRMEGPRCLVLLFTYCGRNVLKCVLHSCNVPYPLYSYVRICSPRNILHKVLYLNPALFFSCISVLTGWHVVLLQLNAKRMRWSFCPYSHRLFIFLYCTTHNTNIHALSGIRTQIPASHRPQIHTLDRVATGIGRDLVRGPSSP